MILEAQSALGAPFGEARDVEVLARPGFEVTERGDLGCVLCTATVDGRDVIADLSAAAGVDMPNAPGAVTQIDRRRALWLSPRSWLIICPPAEELHLVASVNAATADGKLLASAFTDYLCWLTLQGEAAEDALRQGSFISMTSEGLPAGHAKRTLVAGIPAVVLRDTTTRWILGVERSRARYFVDWLKAVDT